MALGQVHQACVVGAGVSGLACARGLLDAGVDVVVIEASTGSGGRARSVAFGDGVVNSGAHWIHHPVGNPLSELCDGFGLGRFAFDLHRLSESQLLIERGTLLPPTLRDGVLALESEFWSAFDPARVGSDWSMRSVVAAFFDRRRDDPAADHARVIVESSLETELCASLDEIAVANFDEVTKPFEGGDDVIVGGYGQLIDALAEGVPVRYGCEVQRIVQHDNHVTVEMVDLAVVDAEQVVVTVPLGVLQAGSVLFSPDLPASMRDAIDCLGFGRFEKVFLQFERCWWPIDNDVTGMYLLDEDVYRYWLDVTATAGAPTLVAHVAGPAADRLAPSATDRVDLAVAALGRGFPGRVPPVLRSHATAWADDPFTRGAYTRLRPVSQRVHIERLMERHGRVMFAGEHTSPTRHGYVDGAYTSGIRAAHQILDELST